MWIVSVPCSDFLGYIVEEIKCDTQGKQCERNVQTIFHDCAISQFVPKGFTEQVILRTFPRKEYTFNIFLLNIQ